MLRNLVSNLRGAKLVAPQTATHLQPRQRFGSVIDLAVFKHIPYNHSIRVLSDLSSDHYPVILEINLNTSLIKNPEQLSTNWSNFKFALNKKPLPTTDLTSNENIELAISELNQNFSEAFVEASKPKLKNVPKILSPEIKSKIHQRNSREIAKDIKSHSQAQWEKHIEALSPEDNTLWRKSSLLRKPFHSIPPLKGTLGSIAITPIEKAEVIADSLQEQFEPNHVADREEFDQRIHEEVVNFLATPHVQEIEPTTPTEVLTYVQRIKPKKSPGLDQITNRDFNAKHTSWGCPINDARGNRLYRYVVNSGIDVIAPHTPTRFGTASATIIDYALMKNLNWPCTIDSISELSSDHNPIKLNFPRTPSFEIPPPQLYTNWKLFTNNLANNDNLYLPQANSTPEIESQVNDLTSEILTAHANASKPMIHREPPFVQGELKQLFRERNRARKLWQFTRFPLHKTELNRIQNKIKRKVGLYRQQL
ncbi:RNA-directed DNA polymerase from mobile element jockey [Trichonephila clavipes]|nr:RNA-directed DNA polymerase from mobile element jockey [Trichonephila clavipes]